MYSSVKIKARIRVPPNFFGKDLKESVEDSVRTEFDGFLDVNQGLFIGLVDVEEIGDGIIIPGDGAIYYDATFSEIAYKPTVQEIADGIITEIAEFGAFAKIGPIEGLIHKSQIMDDFVSYSKTGSLAGKDSNRALKIGDKVRARIIAANLKNLQTAKIGLTMRQEGLGVIGWEKKTAAPKVKEEKSAEKPTEHGSGAQGQKSSAKEEVKEEKK